MTVPAKDPSRFVETRIDDETVVMVLDRGNFFSLSSTAQAIWAAIDGVRDEAGIVAEVARAYRLVPQAVAQEVAAFLAELNAAGLRRRG